MRGFQINAALGAALLFSGCGLEALVADRFDTDYVERYSELVVQAEDGVDLSELTLSLQRANGDEVKPEKQEVRKDQARLSLKSGSYPKLVVVAKSGGIYYTAFAVGLEAESAKTMKLGPLSTTAFLVLEGWASLHKHSLASLDGPAVRREVDTLTGKMEGGTGDEGALYAIFGRIFGGATLAQKRSWRQVPVVVTATVGPQAGKDVVEKSPVRERWLQAAMVDYTGDGAVDAADLNTEALDSAYLKVVKAAQLAGCLDPKNLRVVLEVDFNDGVKSGSCGGINKWAWTKDEPGKQMFFVGGLHKDSPIQDPAVDASLGNNGSWSPNVTRMYDDGSNGDETAGDGIWTISFVLPVGARIGYKYTWGHQGDVWGGTEEWPGNQRILEIRDVNSDGFVRRRDAYGDEAANKDLVNLNPNIGDTLGWEDDKTGGGPKGQQPDTIPDAQERPLDLDNNCSLDNWRTPTGIGPATVSCAEIEGQ